VPLLRAARHHKNVQTKFRVLVDDRNRVRAIFGMVR
jgi:hypothetical protein